jgi:hypothetical protein
LEGNGVGKNFNSGGNERAKRRLRILRRVRREGEGRGERGEGRRRENTQKIQIHLCNLSGDGS